MLIVNADDWGRSVMETDAALWCHRRGRITSATAMLFMEDSARAAELALAHRLDTGLHLNLSQSFTACPPGSPLERRHERVCRFINSHKYAFLLYHPGLRNDFLYTFNAQLDEYRRLYGKEPSHIDGHHHKHLCSNVLWSRMIPEGTPVRRSFHFRPGEKSGLNRAYRAFVDSRLQKRHRIVDYFFALSRCLREERLQQALSHAGSGTVELMTHPAMKAEFECLMSEPYRALIAAVRTGTYADIGSAGALACPDH